MRASAQTNLRSAPAMANPPTAPSGARLTSPAPAWSNRTTISLPRTVCERCVGPACSTGWPYATCRAASASRAPTSCLLRGWMSCASPMSMITACAVFGSDSAAVCASRSTAHALCAGGCESAAMKFASCTQRKGNSPERHSRRQLVIIVRNSAAYSCASATLSAFDSPWYQSTPLIGMPSSGCTIRL